MTQCRYCQGKEGETCTTETIKIDRRTYKRIPYARLENGSETTAACPDCGISHGGFHHADCPKELCPKCRAETLLVMCLYFDSEHLQSENP